MAGYRSHKVVVFAFITLAAFNAFGAEGSYVHSSGIWVGAGVANPRDASWMVLNPAGLVDLDRRLDVDLSIAITDVTMEPHGLFGNHFVDKMTDHQYFFLTSGGLVWPTGKGALALGSYTSAGFAVDFPQPRNFFTRMLQGNADRRLRYQQTQLVLAGARELGHNWSIGGSLKGSLSLGRTDNFTRFLHPTRGDNRWDQALGAGLSIGVYKKWDKWAFAACYHTPQWSERFEKYKDLLRWSVDLPEIVQLGVAYHVTPEVELVLDYRFLHWEDCAFFAGHPHEGGLGWKDEHVVSLGVEWHPADRWTLRSGVSHGNGPVQPEYASVNGLTCVVTENYACAGASYKLNERSEVHVNYVRALYNEMRAWPPGDVFTWLTASTEIGLGYDALVLGYTFKF